MATARRWYFYGVAFISQMMLFGGVVGLLRELLAFRGAGPANRALYISLIAVGLPVYLLHWWLAQRAVQRGSDARGATLRKAYIYGVQAVTTFFAFDSLHNLLSSLLTPVGLPSDAVLQLAVLIASALFWGYHARLARADARLEPESGGGATIRRWYQFGLAASALVVWSLAAHFIIVRMVVLATGTGVAGNAQQFLLTDNITLLVTGLVAWLPVWLMLQRRAAEDVDEQRSVLRKFYLYAAVLAGAGFALFSLAAWLQAFLAIVFGEPAPAVGALVEDTANSLVTSLLGALIWFYHARVLDSDARTLAEAPRQAAIRRLYYYLVAGVSLTALLFGIAQTAEILVRVLMDWQPAVAPEGWWRRLLAWGVAATVVGLPVWLRAWRRMQSVALAATLAGSAERRATLRKIYLYGVALVTALVVLVNLASALYQLLRLALGESSGSGLLGDFAGGLVNTIVVAVAWFYHIIAIRRDGSFAPAQPLAAGKALTVVIAADGAEDFGAMLAVRLRVALPNGEVVVLLAAGDRAAQLARADILVATPSGLLRNTDLSAGAAKPALPILLVPLAGDHVSVLGQTAPMTADQAADAAVEWLRNNSRTGQPPAS